MATIGAYEAKVHLSELLDRVNHGERITITKHGRAVAVLVPPRDVSAIDLVDAITELRSFSGGRTTGGLTIKEMIEEGRRA